MDTYYVDGDFVGEAQALIPANDLIVLRGYGVFDFLVTYNRRPFHLEDHVDRLLNSAAQIGLGLSHKAGEICEIVGKTLDRNPHHKESAIRLVYSGGISPDGVTPQGNGILMVMATPRTLMSEACYTKGVKIITMETERFIPLAKSTNYLSAVFALQEAKKQKAVEAVYKDRSGRLLEGTTSNLFCIQGSRLITPPDNILPGITRKVTLDLAKADFEIELRHIQAQDLTQMDEVFITASNKEIMPVVQVDNLTIGSGAPGPRTRQLMAAWEAYTTAWGKKA